MKLFLIRMAMILIIVLSFAVMFAIDKCTYSPKDSSEIYIKKLLTE